MPIFTKDYFLGELSKFRTLMGSRSFWKDETKQQNALQAIGYVYLNTENDDIENLFVAATNEFSRRKALVEIHGTPKD